MGDLSGEILTATDGNIYGFYQDWVHKNPRTYLDGRIEEDGKRQDMWKELVCMPTQRYDVSSGPIRNKFVWVLLVDLNGIWNC